MAASIRETFVRLFRTPSNVQSKLSLTKLIAVGGMLPMHAEQKYINTILEGDVGDVTIMLIIQ